MTPAQTPERPVTPDTPTPQKDERITMPYDEAITYLAPKGRIHTLMNPNGTLLGADWRREQVLSLLKSAERIDITGEMAQRMKHGLAVDDGGRVVFIETIRRTDGR